MSPQPRRRRLARDVARAAAALSGVMLVLGLANGANGRVSAAPAGALTILKGANPGAGGLLTSGGSATVFALQPPTGAACTGDGTKGYRIQTFMVSSSVNLDTMKFDAGGPSPASTGTTVRIPLFSSGNPVVDVNPALTTGAIPNVGTFSFAINGFTAAAVPNGAYNMGFACTQDTAAGKVLDKYWTVGITITASAADTPSGFTWATGGGGSTTTTTAPTTTVAGATTTTIAGATTTTAVTDSTSVDTTDSTDVTDSSVDSTDSTFVDSAGIGDDGDFTGGGGGELVSTGSSPMPTLVWGMLLLVFGRMAILLARPVKVVDDGAS